MSFLLLPSQNRLPEMPSRFHATFAGASHGSKFWLKKALVPLCLLEEPSPEVRAESDKDGLAFVDLRIEHGRISAVLPGGTAPCCGPGVNLERGQVWPCPVDLHTHLDKGHIWPRQENPDGTFMGALDAVVRDREANWSARDVAARMEFGLKCSYAHGTRAVRTHLDLLGKQAEISWQVFAETRERWEGRITLQAVSLVMPETYLTDEGTRIAELTARHGGVLGCVTYMIPPLDATLDRLFVLATEHGLDVDFHVDETDDPGAVSLRHIAEAALRNRFKGRILCGHCCSLATQEPEQALSTLDLVAEAGIAVVALPMCNLYLQDRAPGRTPRWRGVTLLHEMRARGIPGGCRLRQLPRPVLRLRRSRHGGGLPRGHPHPAPRLPVRRLAACRDDDTRPDHGPERCRPYRRRRVADLVVFRARGFSELLSRPQSDRVVLRAGLLADAKVPDYRELDGLFEVSGGLREFR